VLGKKDFFFEDVAQMPDEEIVATFLQQFYDRDRIIPKKVILPTSIPGQSVLQQWLSDRCGHAVSLLSPSRGASRSLIDLALDNAKSASKNRFQDAPQQCETALVALQSLLHLSCYPYRIEGYDISNIMGTSAVGSMVVFEAGAAKKNDYRHFKIKTIEGANDFAMMAEMLTRRVATAMPNPPLPLEITTAGTVTPPVGEGDQQGSLPHLILIDGGKGQVSAVRTVLEKAGWGSIDLIGLAKEKNGRPERVYLPDLAEPILLPPGSPATHLLMQVRDEAHRFAISYHRKIRSQKMLHSPLEEIAGIGQRRRLALLRHFGSLEKIREAPLEEIETVPDLPKKVAQQLFDALHSGGIIAPD